MRDQSLPGDGTPFAFSSIAIFFRPALTLLLQIFNYIDKVPERPAKPVELPDYQRVARPQGCERLVQSGPLARRTGFLLPEYPRTPC